MRHKGVISCLGAAVLLAVTGCSGFKTNPVTWEDIASTIPSNPTFIASLNVSIPADTAFNDVWGNQDMSRVLSMGLALDTVLPSHVVVAGVDGVTYVTWPLQNPRLVWQNIDNWETASLNNTVDAHICVVGSASIVISSTQAWVVNNQHAADNVNDLLSAAMNTKAAHTQPFAQCITTTPAMGTLVVPYEGRYYVADLNHEDGLLRVDVNAYSKSNNRVNIVDGLGRLPYEFIDKISPVSPFAAIEIERGTMPEAIVRIAKLFDKRSIKLASQLVAPVFENADGTVTTLWDDRRIRVKVPFTSREAAATAAANLKNILHTTGYDIEVRTHKDTLDITHAIDAHLPFIDADRRTPSVYSQTENPSAVAFARLDLSRKDPVEAYFELAPTHARLQVDFKDNPENLAQVIEFVKNIVFRIL